MGKSRRYLALNFGVDSGAAVAGAFDGHRIGLETLLRFDVRSTPMLAAEFWDFPAMLRNARTGLAAFAARCGRDTAGVACDSWPVDFGLLDKTGHLLANPLRRLDPRVAEAAGRLDRVFPERGLYQRTGVRADRGDTLFRLFAMARDNSPLLDKAVTMLLMADLVSYFLTGIAVQEYTLACSTGMYGLDSRDWSRDVILGAKIPPMMMPEVVAPGTVIGPLLESVALGFGLGQTPVVAPAGDGTAGALAAVPAEEGDDWICVFSEHGCRVSAELTEPVVNDAAFAAGFSNLGGVDGSIRLLRDVPGLGPLEDCARAWSRGNGTPMELADVLGMAERAGLQEQVLNLEGAPLDSSDDMPELIAGMLADSGQEPAAGRGELAAIYLAGVVVALAEAVRRLSGLTGVKYRTLHLVGRGADQPLFARWLADATGMTVRAGPVEARPIGNILMQMLALGDASSLAEGREIVARSLPPAEFEPGDGSRWDDVFAALFRVK